MRQKQAPTLIALFLPAVSILFMFIISGCAGAPPAETAAEDDLEAKMAEEETVSLSSEAIIFDATLAAQNSDYKKALELLTGLIENEPENIEALRLLAKVHSADGNKDSAAKTWRKVAELDPSDPDAAYEIGIELARSKKWDELRTRMMMTESLGTADNRHYLLIGQAGMERGYRDEAEKYLLKAGELELATALLGKLYYGRGKTAESEKAFKKTLRLNPENYIANLHMGYISYNRGNRQTALEYYGKAHSSDPGDPLACISLASLHEQLSHQGKAIEYYTTALKLKKIPRSEKKKAYVSLSRLLVKTGQLNRVYPLVQEGIAEFPSSGGLYFYWGEALLKHGRSAEAKEKYKKAALDPAWKKPALERFHSIR
ncbi:MAG: tetratricopeptide repeat protein [Candidatus Krumholzibacteriota bacterium]|nr:tetratricopeptide repeat protein [Candidatus Krumholzibacteriota bacterium]